MSANRSSPSDAIHPVDRHVGRRVAEKRLLLGHNQSELGRALEVSFQQVQKYEKGANRISSSKLWAIARFLQVDVRYFFEGLDTVGEDQTGPEVILAPVTRMGLEISRLAPRLSPAQQRLVLDLMREFSAEEILSQAA